jgi:flavin-dependent dehydrogenase
MVGYSLENTLSENGSVSRGVCVVNENGHLDEVTERTNIKRLDSGNVGYLNGDGNYHDLSANAIVSMNYWGFHPNVFAELRAQFQAFLTKNASSEKAEFYIPSVVSQLIEEGKADVTVLTSDDQWYGVTYKEDKAMVQQAFQQLLADGVYPEQLF